MNLVDSSGWLEYFADGPNAGMFAVPIQQLDQLIVPSITVTEVFKRILQQRDEQAALRAIAHMNQGRVIDLDINLAMKAAKFGFELKLPLADSIILATASHYGALLWTQDEDFRELPSVRYVPKKPR